MGIARCRRNTTERERWIYSPIPGYGPVLLLPGLFVLFYWGYTTGGLGTYILLWGIAWGIEGVYQQVRRGYGRAFGQVFPAVRLQPGAILRHSIWLQGGEERPVCVEGEEEAGEIVSRGGRPLSEHEVDRLRRLGQQAVLPRGDVVELEQSIPFVLFIVAGAVLTAFFAGSVVWPLTRLALWLGE